MMALNSQLDTSGIVSLQLAAICGSAQEATNGQNWSHT